MKKFFTALICATMVFGLAGCGSSGDGPKEDAKKEYVSEEDVAKVYTDPDSYKGKYIKLTGKVFTQPEKDDKGIYFQMWADPENSELNTVVGYKDSNFEIKENDYVILEGRIDGEFEGDNSFGGKIKAITVIAENLKVSSYAEVMVPTLKEVVTEGLTNSQNGVDITVSKVEFAKNETRIYYSVTNNSGSNYSFYDFNMKAVQNGKQFDMKDNYEADYPSVSGDVLNGVKSEGIASFPAMEQANFDVHFDAGYSDNYDLDFTEFNFNINVK